MRRATYALSACLALGLPRALVGAEPGAFPAATETIAQEMSETITPAQTESPPLETPPPTRRPSLPARVFQRVKQEAGRYVADAAGIVTAPAKWDSRDWKKLAGATVILGGLFLADESIDHGIQNNRSHFTDRVSAATTSLGGGRGPELAGVLIASGILLHSPNTRDLGRDAIEAGLFTLLLNQLALTRVGRVRPYRTDGETSFEFGSRNTSFPSGHATEAFSVASVVAMRAPGWIIPGLAYAAATVVAFDRLNDRVHFASDVFAGAVLGTVTGRWLVARHRREEEKGAPEEKNTIPKISFDIVPIRNGLSAQFRF